MVTGMHGYSRSECTKNAKGLPAECRQALLSDISLSTIFDQNYIIYIYGTGTGPFFQIHSDGRHG